MGKKRLEAFSDGVGNHYNHNGAGNESATWRHTGILKTIDTRVPELYI